MMEQFMEMETLCEKAAVLAWNEQEGVDKIVETDILIVEYVDYTSQGVFHASFLKRDAHVYFAIECNTYTGDIHVEVKEYDPFSDKPISESSTLLFEKDMKVEDLL